MHSFLLQLSGFFDDQAGASFQMCLACSGGFVLPLQDVEVVGGADTEDVALGY